MFMTLKQSYLCIIPHQNAEVLLLAGLRGLHGVLGQNASQTCALPTVLFPLDPPNITCQGANTPLSLCYF